GALLHALGCGGSQATRDSAARARDAVVMIECPVADAELWVDDRFVSHLGRLKRGVAVSPGAHRIEIRHDRYHTHYEELTVEARERRTLTVELAEILD